MKFLLIATTTLCFCATSARADCTAEIKAMMDAHLKAGAYHSQIDMDMGAIKRKTEVDVILPSSFHMKSEQMEAIVLANGAWMKAGGKWMAMPAGVSGQITSGIKNNMDTSKMNLSNVQCLGMQRMEGQSYTAYSFDSSAEVMGTKATSHITTYKNSNGLPAIMMIEGEAMGHKSKTMQHITYDPNITISPPK